MKRALFSAAVVADRSRSDRLSLLRIWVYVILLVAIVFDEPTFGSGSLTVVDPPPIVYDFLIGRFRIVDFLVLFAFANTLAHRAVILRQPVRWVSPFNESFWLWVLAICVAIVSNLARGQTEIGIFVWKNLILGGLFFYVFLNAFTSLEELHRLFSRIAWVLWVKSVVILAAYFAGMGLTVSLEIGREMTLLSAQLMMYFALAGSFWVGEFLFKRSINPTSIVKLTLQLVPLLLVVAFSYRRSPLLIMVSAFIATTRLLLGRTKTTGLLLGKIKKKRAWQLWLLSGFLASVVVLMFPERVEFVLQRVWNLRQNIQMDPRFNDTGRLFDYVDAFSHIAENPVLGTGLAGTAESKFFAMKTWTGVHNGALESWLRFGLLGAIAYVYFFVSYLRTLFANLRGAFTARSSGLAGVGVFGAVYYAFTVFFLPGPFTFQTSLLAALCAAVVTLSGDLHSAEVVALEQ